MGNTLFLLIVAYSHKTRLSQGCILDFLEVNIKAYIKLTVSGQGCCTTPREPVCRII